MSDNHKPDQSNFSLDHIVQMIVNKELDDLNQSAKTIATQVLEQNGGNTSSAHLQLLKSFTRFDKIYLKWCDKEKLEHISMSFYEELKCWMDPTELEKLLKNLFLDMSNTIQLEPLKEIRCKSESRQHFYESQLPTPH